MLLFAGHVGSSLVGRFFEILNIFPELANYINLQLHSALQNSFWKLLFGSPYIMMFHVSSDKVILRHFQESPHKVQG
jgi:uncharacterized membrane protein